VLKTRPIITTQLACDERVDIHTQDHSIHLAVHMRCMSVVR